MVEIISFNKRVTCPFDGFASCLVDDTCSHINRTSRFVATRIFKVRERETVL